MKTKLFFLFAIVMGTMCCCGKGGKVTDTIVKEVENYRPKPGPGTIKNIERVKNYVSKCGKCDGKGWVHVTDAYGQYLVNAYGQYVFQACDACGGSGKRY